MSVGLVPDDVRRRLYDAAIEAASQATHHRWPRLARVLAWFHSDAKSRERFDRALDRALKAFLDSLEQRNAPLAQTLRAQESIWRSPVLHKALREILASPGASRFAEWRDVRELFVEGVPALADDAVLLDVTLQLLVSCMAAELCLLPEFRDLYRFEFERRAAQSTVQLAEHLAQMTDFVRAGSAYPPITSLPATAPRIALALPSGAPRLVNELPVAAQTRDGLWTLADQPHSHSTIVVVGPDTRRVALLPTDETPDYSYLEFFGDKDTILEATVFLARTHPQATISRYPASWLPQGLRPMPLVVVGGPSDDDGVGGNRIARQIIDHYKLPLTYHDDCEGLDYAGSSYRTAFDAAGRIILDWGLVVRLKNPWNAQTRVLLIQGVHTHGVLGAFRAITDPALANDGDFPLDAHDPLFAALVRVDVLDGTVTSTRLKPGMIHAFTTA